MVRENSSRPARHDDTLLPVTDALARARADLAAGRAWLARDRLDGLLRDRQDDEVLALLVEVHRTMGDLPRAGALLVVLGGEGPEHEAALAAWRRRHGDADARWRSIPAPVRSARADRIAALQEAEQGRPLGERDLPAADPHPDSPASVAGCLLGLLAVLVVVVVLLLAVVGAVAVVRWI